MSDSPDHDSRTESPTEKKLRDATERGDIPVSREAGHVAYLLALFGILALVLPASTHGLIAALLHFLDDPAGWRLNEGGDAIYLFTTLAKICAAFLLPIVLILALAGVAASVAQNAPRFVTDRIVPDISRISVRRGLERLVGPRGWVELGKSMFKLVVMIGVAGYVVWNGKEFALQSIGADAGVLPVSMIARAKTLVVAMGVTTLAIGAGDIVWSRLLWLRDQRMTKQEVKEELRQAEGDRLIKARIRSIQLDRSRKRMLAAVPQATMVIANPTHYAVALRYVYGQSGAPTVVAKGVDLIALRIRDVAEKSSIPVIEDPPLARSLYASVEVDQAIPPEFYHAVAELVHTLRKKAGERPYAQSGNA